MHPTRLRIGMITLFVMAAFAWLVAFDKPHPGNAGVPADVDRMKALEAEVAALKELLPDQSHAMSDAAYHFTNLWFAAQAANWPLADFYWKESRSHLRWAVRIKPVRKDNANKEVMLADILQAMENGPLKQIGDSIAAKDRTRFVAAYRFTLETCYACHKASDKPYLRPQIPTRPEVSIINPDPNAAWPR